MWHFCLFQYVKRMWNWKSKMQFASRPLLEMWFGCNSAAIPISDCGQTADLPPPQRVYLRLGMISYLSTPSPSPISPFQRIIQITFASLPATCASSFPHLLIYPSVYHNSAHIWNVVWAPFGYPGTFLNTPKDTGSVSFTPGLFWAPFWTLFCKIQGSSGGNFGANLGSKGQIWVMVVHQLGNAMQPSCPFAWHFGKHLWFSSDGVYLLLVAAAVSDQNWFYTPSLGGEEAAAV